MKNWNSLLHNPGVNVSPFVPMDYNAQCEKTQDTVKENWSEKMLPNYQILC